ncbi:hypothetical protein [Sphingopyxis sp.]|uniref:hypothetical protein n=1 Tax=Sphingopyxis sp. TaxID=1908224 RepID=UPI003BA92EEF
MQIDVDFDVYKALTLLWRSEADTHSHVLRRILTLADISTGTADQKDQVLPKPFTILAVLKDGISPAGPGSWIGNVFFPEGTKFRATYKGSTFHAEIKNEVWIDRHGVKRQSPSEAAGAISGTKVNGWNFWYAKRPTDSEWLRLDEFRK